MLCVKHPHTRDALVSFIEGKYLYNEQLKSRFRVTEWIKSFFPPFSATLVSRQLESSSNGRYAGMDSAAIQQSWVVARDNGIAFHAMLENILNDEEPCEYVSKVPPHPCPQEVLMAKARLFLHEEIYKAQLAPYRTEWMLFGDEKYPLGGTLDLVCVDKQRLGELLLQTTTDNESMYLPLVLFDHKLSRRIYSTGFQNSLGYRSCSHLPDCNLTHYSLAMNTYQYLLENHMRPFWFEGHCYRRAVVVSRRLDVFHPEDGSVQVIHVPNMQDDIRRMLQETFAPAE